MGATQITPSLKNYYVNDLLKSIDKLHSNLDVEQISEIFNSAIMYTSCPDISRDLTKEELATILTDYSLLQTLIMGVYFNYQEYINCSEVYKEEEEKQEKEISDLLKDKIQLQNDLLDSIMFIREKGLIDEFNSKNHKKPIFQN